MARLLPPSPHTECTWVLILTPPLRTLELNALEDMHPTREGSEFYLLLSVLIFKEVNNVGHTSLGKVILTELF